MGLAAGACVSVCACSCFGVMETLKLDSKYQSFFVRLAKAFIIARISFALQSGWYCVPPQPLFTHDNDYILQPF